MENFGELMCNLPKFYPPNYKDFIIAHIVDFVIVHKIVIPLYIYMQSQNSYQHFEVLQTCEIFCSLSSPSLPEPNGLLSKKVPSKAIELANTEVERTATW